MRQVQAGQYNVGYTVIQTAIPVAGTDYYVWASSILVLRKLLRVIGIYRTLLNQTSAVSLP